MDEEVEMILDMAREGMQASVEHLDNALVHIRAGKASTRMLDTIMVEYYGSQTPLSQVSNISTPDAKTIAIQPWEKNIISDIETSNYQFESRV